MNSILLVEDDVFLRDGIAGLLGAEGYSVSKAANKAQAESLLTTSSFDLIILDVMLPDGNGLDICRALRTKKIGTPVLFLTACDDENEIVAGFDAGGDDYLTKPFGTRVLLARIRSLLRRGAPVGLSFGDLTIDESNMTVTKGGENIFVTLTEFRILIRLIRAGSIVTRSALLSEIWDCDENYIDDNTLSVHVSRLREKIGGKYIKTVRGIGYRWEAGE